MPAIAAEVFIIVAATFREIQEMPGEQTHRWVLDLAPSRLCLEKRMTTIARVLMESVAGRHEMYRMSKQVAQVSNLLGKGRLIGVGIASNLEKQRMPALDTDILVMTRPHGDLLIPMSEYKARDRVGHPSFFATAQITNAAAAVFFGTSHRFERHVAHLVAEQQAG